MKTVTLSIPERLNMDTKEVALLVAKMLYEQGTLSLVEAAEMAGLTKDTFTELLGKNNVSISNDPASNLSEDIANA
ncbi:MAG: UPF0175 family protein [Ginsengibacter sp.]